MVDIKLKNMVMGALAYFVINIKSLLIDKVSFIWSITFPLIMFYINIDSISHVLDLSYYWCYMIISSYLFGLGIYAVEMRESGCLKTIFSINNSKVAYILGNIVTQLVYTLICVSVFNLLVMFKLKYNFFEMETSAIILMLLCLPIGIGSYAVVVLHSFYISSIKTLITILLFFLLIITGSNSYINEYNLLYIIPTILFGYYNYLPQYIVICTLLVVTGLIGMYDFGAISKEKR